MKKVLLGFAVASVFAACNDAKSKTDSTTTDSTNVKVDTSGITSVTDSVKVATTKK